jgi:hypothetical protein
MMFSRHSLAIAALTLGLSALDLGTASMAVAEDIRALNECVHRKATFDGTEPLHYFKVTGYTGSKLYIQPKHPSTCSSANDKVCRPFAYIVPGDIVAVGKTCNGFAFLQYIGDKHITVGWVAASELTTLSTTPDQTVRPAVANGQHFMEPPRFKLMKGHGIPLCEAYLQRLNAIVYSDPPYCDRPENDAIPGFKVLDRVPLETQEMIEMSGSLFKRWVQPNPHLTASWQIDERGAMGIGAWRYKETIDLGNNGQPQNVLVWQGYGLSGGPMCGRPANNKGPEIGWRPRQLPLVLQQDNKSIDEQKTAEIFGSQGKADWVVDRPWVPKDGVFPFRPIGRSIGIFEYRGIIYFDTFFDLTGDDQGKRAGVPRFANTLGVFLRKHERTSEICEMEMAGTDYSKTEEGY